MHQVVRGASVPADGVVVVGTVEVDESMLTGRAPAVPYLSVAVCKQQQGGFPRILPSGIENFVESKEFGQKPIPNFHAAGGFGLTLGVVGC